MEDIKNTHGMAISLDKNKTLDEYYENAKKQKYHHIMGTCGYKTNMPKWKKDENDLIGEGVNPKTSGWAKRTKDWFYEHWWECIYTKEHLETPYKELKTSHQQVHEGKLHPDRENDELTRAHGNVEH